MKSGLRCQARRIIHRPTSSSTCPNSWQSPANCKLFQQRMLRPSWRLALKALGRKKSTMHCKRHRLLFATRSYRCVSEAPACAQKSDPAYQLTHSVARLDPAWRTRLRHRTLFLNPILISDVFSVLHMTSASLRLVEPLPESLPYLREHSTLDLPRPHIKEDDEKTLTWEEFEVCSSPVAGAIG